MKRKTHSKRTDVTAILIERAAPVLACHETILLTSDDYSLFLKALDDDRKPSTRSRAAAKRYRRATSQV